MLIYVLLFSFVTLCIFFNDYRFAIGRYSFLSVNLFQLTVIAVIVLVSFRGLSVGTDTYPYDLNYKYIVNNNFDFSKSPYSAPVYYLINFMLGYITENGASMRVFQACVTYYCVYKIVCKNNVNKFLSLCLFIGWSCFACSMNISRQMLSVLLALYATYLFLCEKRIFFSIIIFAIATLIHITSIVIIAIPFFAIIYRYMKELHCFFLVSIFIALLLNFVYKFVIFFVINYVEHYRAYTTAGVEFNIFEQNTSGNFFYIYLLFFLLIVIFVLKVKNYYYPPNSFAYSVLPFLTICMVIGLLNPCNVMIYSFLIPSFVLFSLVFIPRLFNLLSFKEKFVFLPVFLLLTVVFFMYSLIIKNSGEIVPYTSIFF